MVPEPPKAAESPPPFRGLRFYRAFKSFRKYLDEKIRKPEDNRGKEKGEKAVNREFNEELVGNPQKKGVDEKEEEAEGDKNDWPGKELDDGFYHKVDRPQDKPNFQKVKEIAREMESLHKVIRG
ncbi:hypothetical protein HYW30_00375 [Candidatus Azambacteria bacterium]|nr:hypothetical protein [Candidatus Azambacteria bacterium]